MKVILALALVGVAAALPLDTAVTNGVFLEESASRPTFAKGIRTDCDYSHHTARTLGHTAAQGDTTPYASLDKAKAVCDEMGPDCGGILEEPADVDLSHMGKAGELAEATLNANEDDIPKEFRLYAGHQLKIGEDDQILHRKTVCALPLPHTNYVAGDSRLLHNAILKVNDSVEGLRWKLQNGPEFARYDDGRDHGSQSRLTDGKSNVFAVDDCIELCAKKSDCASGHYCAQGIAGHAGNCFLSGDWEPHGTPVDEMSCSKVQNFRKKNDWVKPVMRTDDGQYIKHQWHSKKPIDEAMAEDQEAAAAEDAAYGAAF